MCYGLPMQPRGQLLRGIAWAVVSAIMAATFLVPWKRAAVHGEPELAVLFMLLAAAILNGVAALLAALPHKHDEVAASEPRWGFTLAVASVFAVLTALANRASASAIERISGALLAVTQRSEILLVALFGAVFLGEPVRPVFALGALVAGAGLWLLERPGHVSAGFDPSGVMYGLGASVGYGLMVVLARRYVARLRVLSFNAVRLWLSVGLCALWWPLSGRAWPGEVPGALVWNAALAGLFGPFLSRLAALESARYVPASITALASLATPAIALLLAWLLLDELPAPRELQGGAMLLVGVAIPVLAMLRREPAPAAPSQT